MASSRRRGQPPVGLTTPRLGVSTVALPTPPPTEKPKKPKKKRGPVVTGDLGDSRCLEFAVLGDSVNVAARLEALTRALASPLAVSGETVEAARAQAASVGLDMARLVPLGPHRLRGRHDEIEVWGIDT